MSSISQVSDALRRVLTTRAKELERETGFVEGSTPEAGQRSLRVQVRLEWDATG
jgi:hypothetical protein